MKREAIEKVEEIEEYLRTSCRYTFDDLDRYLKDLKSLLQTGDDWVSVDEFKRDDGRKYPIMVNGSPIFYWIAEYVGQKYPQIGYVDVQKGDKWYSAYSTGSQELEPLYVKRFNQPQPRLPDNTAKKDGK